MTETGKPRTGRQGGGSFEERLSPLIAVLGVTGVPDLLLRYQSRLGLTSNELIYIVHILRHRRDATHWPWLAVSEVIDATGAGERSVRDWRASLVRKQLLVLRPRGVAGTSGGGRLSDEHDLSQLFAALEALALEEMIQRAADATQRELPVPSFYRPSSSIADVPQLPSRERRGLKTQRARPERSKPRQGSLVAERAAGREGYSAENRRVPPRATLPEPAGLTMPEPAELTLPEPAESTMPEPAESVLPEPAESTLPVPADEAEVFQQKLLPEGHATDVKTGCATASRSPRIQKNVNPPESMAREGGAAEPSTPEYRDEGVCLYIEQWAAEFGDDDAARSIEQAHRLLWNARRATGGVFRVGDFHNAMKAARHETQKRMEQDKPSLERPMAYFFTVLRTELKNRCSRMGFGTVDDDAEVIDDDLAEAAGLEDSGERVRGAASAPYDKAAVRERVWRRSSGEERRAMWKVACMEDRADDRAAYAAFVTQGLDWPSSIEDLAAYLPDAEPQRRAVAGAA